MNKIYYGGVYTIGVIVMIAIWIYSLYEWGILFGLLFGWIPALIGGVIVGLAWPIIAVFFIYLVSQ